MPTTEGVSPSTMFAKTRRKVPHPLFSHHVSVDSNSQVAKYLCPRTTPNYPASASRTVGELAHQGGGPSNPPPRSCPYLATFCVHHTYVRMMVCGFPLPANSSSTA